MIYFVQDTVTQSIKIGLSNKPKKRLGALQTANPHLLVLLGTIPGSADDEASFHVQFAEHRLQGEWFSGEIIESILAIIASKQRKVRSASMNGNEMTGKVEEGDAAIQGMSQIPGLKLKSLKMELREERPSKGSVTCYVELKYVLEFEEDVSQEQMHEIRNLFSGSRGSQPHARLRHVFLDEENVVIPFLAALPCWVPHGQHTITGVKGLGFRVIVSGSESFSTIDGYSGLRYEGEHPLKKARKLIVHNRG